MYMFVRRGRRFAEAEESEARSEQSEARQSAFRADAISDCRFLALDSRILARARISGAELGAILEL